MKICSRCKTEKKYSDYHKNKTQIDGHKNQCKLCIKYISMKYRKNNKDKLKSYYELNKEKINKKNRKYKDKNKDKIKITQKLWRETKQDKVKEKNRLIKYRNENNDTILKRQKEWRQDNKEKILIYAKEYRKNNKNKINKYYRDRYTNDHLFKLSQNIIHLISGSFKTSNNKKKSKTQEILG